MFAFNLIILWDIQTHARLLFEIHCWNKQAKSDLKTKVRSNFFWLLHVIQSITFLLLAHIGLLGAARALSMHFKDLKPNLGVSSNVVTLQIIPMIVSHRHLYSNPCLMLSVYSKLWGAKKDTSYGEI